MLRKIMTATVLAAAAMGVNAEDFYLKPAPKGMEMNLLVTVQKSFPNDKARIVFSTMSEAKDLATAQRGWPGPCSRNLWICAANPILCVLRTKRGYRFAADENSLNFFYIGVSEY